MEAWLKNKNLIMGIIFYTELIETLEMKQTTQTHMDHKTNIL